MPVQNHFADATYPCTMDGCEGDVLVAATVGVQIRTSCHGFSMAYACGVCGRLYLPYHGKIDEVMSRSGEAAYLNGGTIENRLILVKES